MRKSKELDDALDACLERLLVKGEAVEQCLQSFPKHADELKPLLETALAIKQVSAIPSRPELRDRVRYQFYRRQQRMETKKSHLVFGWQPLWATVVTIILVLLLAGGGIVAAAGGSMPDELLYPVKLATEQIRLALTPSALGKAELYAELSDRRVTEIIRMAGEGKPEQIERTTRRLDAYLTRIADLASTQKVTAVPSVAPAPAAKEAVIAEEAVPTVPSPPAAKEALTAAETPAVEKAPLMSERAGGGKEKGIRDDRRAKLRETVVHQADEHSARLRALLETTPPSAIPALRRAIAVSETGYEKAVKSLDQP